MNAQKKAPPPALEKPRQPGGIRSVFLALAVHAAFFALIVFGVTWQSRPDTPVQAEIWDKLPPVPAKAAPKQEPRPPEPEPPRQEPPKPEPMKPPPKPPEEKPEPPRPDPAIAKRLEREKEKKEKVEREKVQKQKEDEAKKKREKDDAEKKKREKDDAEKKKREDEVKRREDERLRAEAEKARVEAAAAKKSEIDSFINQIKNKIRGKANVPDTVTGNPEVQVRIRVLPGGEVLDITVTRKSGNPTYDAAIERGIRSASPLPVPAANSELFPQFRDLNLNFRHER